MKLNLAHTVVRSMSFKETESKDGEENNFEFRTSIGWSKDDPSSDFSVIFSILLQDNSGYELSMEYEGIFRTDITIDEKFVESAWPNVNGAAIVFPFLRAFVSTLTLNSGHSPAILPAINFQKIYNDEKKEAADSKDKASPKPD